RVRLSRRVGVGLPRWRVLLLSYYFFFQAEDGIRDRNVTGVQTCALPISPRLPKHNHRFSGDMIQLTRLYQAIVLPKPEIGYGRESSLKNVPTTELATGSTRMKLVTS